MSLLYRAVWEDDSEDLIGTAETTFQSWVSQKRIDLAIPEEGAVETEFRGGVVEIVARRVGSGAVQALQLELAEERERSGERWTTRMTAVSDTSEMGKGGQWLWVDLERVAHGWSTQPLLAAPRLVQSLITSGSDARVDHVRLTKDAQLLRPPSLAALVKHADRSLPLVVFSEDPDAGLESTRHRANGVAQRLAGAAQVWVLPATDFEDFAEAIGPDLGVWGGAARVYLPNSGPTGMRPGRHRYVTSRQMGGDSARATMAIAGVLTSTITARRPPKIYDVVRRDLRLGVGGDSATLLEVAELEIARLSAERDDLKDRVGQVESDLIETQVDLDAAVDGHLGALNALQVISIGDQSSVEAKQTFDLAAVNPQDVTEALRVSRELLGRIEIPDSAERDLEDLDTYSSSAAWGKLTWNGLRALHLYAEADFDGNFKTWCSEAGHSWAWGANKKSLAMSESETVQSNPRMASQRLLPVDSRVDESGNVHMWAHLKIAEGGGRLAPRVYFYDDTRGPTGNIHIGFVGPHHHMENTRTN